jgi:hypothetical protein
MATTPQTTALTVIEPSDTPTDELTPCIDMDSDALGAFVRDGMLGVAQKLVTLKPYIEELYRRIDRGETILGCSTKKEFCDRVLLRTPRAVRYMLEGGNHRRTQDEGEIVSPQESPNTDVEVPNTEPLDASDAEVLPAIRMPASLRDIRLELCSRTDPRYENIRENHYIDNHGCIGQQAHFLIHYKGALAGIISGASPVFATSSRDQFFGIGKSNRGKFLQGIVNNIVFRLENHESNLASRVLSVWRNIIPHYWYEKYGAVVYGFETFVIETDARKGALYKADNWTLAGTTSGATKVRNGIENPADNWKSVTPKLVYCRWRDGFDSPCAARTPEWVRQMTGDVSPSPEDQPWKTRTIGDRWAAAGSQAWTHDKKPPVEANWAQAVRS